MIRPNAPSSGLGQRWSASDRADRKLFTRHDYRRMIESGVLTSEDRVELIHGEIINMTPLGPEHSSVTDKLAYFFIRHLGDDWICRNQGPQATDDLSEPEPDIQLLKYRDDFYKEEHPAPEDVVLVVEVAKSSLARDRGLKLSLYASAGIPEYWIADLTRDVMIIHRDPDQAAGEYRSVRHAGLDEQVAPAAAEDCVLDLGWLFG